MKKHLQAKDLVALLGDVNNTMGDDSYCVVIIDEHEYPVTGIETYDGVFCRVVVGAEYTKENPPTRVGEDVFVKE